MEETLQSSQSRSSDTKDENQRKISAAARRVLQKVEEEEGEADDTVEAWQKRAEEVVGFMFKLLSWMLPSLVAKGFS